MLRAIHRCAACMLVVPEPALNPAQDSNDADSAIDVWGGELRARAEAAQADREKGRLDLVQQAEMFDTSTATARVEELVRAMHGSGFCEVDAARTLKTINKKVGIPIEMLRTLYAKHRPAPVRRIVQASEITTLEPGRDLWDALGLDQNDAGTQVLGNLNNAAKVLEADTRLCGRVWFDEFANRVRTSIRFDNMLDFSPGPGREWADVDDLLLTQHMQAKVGMAHMRSDIVKDAVSMVAMSSRINPPREWLESLVWDGVERLELVMHVGFGAEDTDFVRAVGRCFFLSIVARVYQPGCQVDTVPVFEGEQGIGKSSALKIIGGEWFGECHESVMNKDFYQVLEGKMLVEVAELNSFSRAEVNRMKGVITCRIDRYRAPYERRASDHPRRTVLAGTTNRDDWNADETGGRRFWPVLCGNVDLDWIREHRDQLFAEAVVRFKRGEHWHDVPAAPAKEAQAARRPDDVWTECVAAYVNGGQVDRGNGVMSDKWDRRDDVTAHAVLLNAIGIATREHTRREEMRITAILRELGFAKRRTLLPGAKARATVWERQA